MKRQLLILIFLGVAFSLFGQTFVNKGAKIVVNDGTNLKLNDFSNSELNSYLYFNSNIDVSGDWINISPATFENGENGSVTLNGKSSQLLKSGENQFKVLIIENSADDGIILTDDLILSGHLFLKDGIIKTGDNKIIFLENAVSEAGNNNSFVFGNMERTGSGSFVFPTGDIINNTQKIWSPVIVIPESYAMTEARYYYENYESFDNSKLDSEVESISNSEYYVLRSDKRSDVGIYTNNADENYIVVYLNNDTWDNMSKGKKQFYEDNFLFGYGIPGSDRAIVTIGKSTKDQLYSETGNMNDPLFVVYPNPFTNELNIITSGMPSNESEIFIYNTLGSLVYTKEILTPQPESSQNINLSNFVPGIYYIKIISGEYINNIKIEKY